MLIACAVLKQYPATSQKVAAIFKCSTRGLIKGSTTCAEEASVEAARRLVRERCQIGEDDNDQLRLKREVLPDWATKSAAE